MCITLELRGKGLIFYGSDPHQKQDSRKKLAFEFSVLYFNYLRNILKDRRMDMLSIIGTLWYLIVQHVLFQAIKLITLDFLIGLLYYLLSIKKLGFEWRP